MGKGCGDKPPTGSLYPRESYVCFFIFLVELAATWSLVALIYNNWIFYLPTAAELEAEFELDPVMCSTTRNIVSNNCTWWSCMEWCLSATQPPDECIHLYANVRQNGSHIRISGCENVNLKQCDSIDLADPVGDFIYNCRTDFTCHHLTGLFLCENTYQPGVPDYQQKVGGACKNLTKMYECHIKAFGETFDCKDKAQCLEMMGTFHCQDGTCIEMLDFTCERRCKDITCDKSVIILSGDDILLGNCDTVTHLDPPHTHENDIIWRDDQVHTLLANCISLELDDEDETNTTFIDEGYENRLDRSIGKNSEMRNIPFDIDITIYKETRLKMNHEGCSNSLSEECTAFHRDFGRDGRNYTTRSRFPCFYTKKYDDFVAAYLDLEVSHGYYMFMLIVPMGIFLGSCFFCIACSFIVIVDEQGHMHLRGCYDWFRPPRTKYEIWLEQHERRKRRGLLEEENEQDF